MENSSVLTLTVRTELCRVLLDLLQRLLPMGTRDFGGCPHCSVRLWVGMVWGVYL